MAKRAKKQVTELITREQCEDVIQLYAEATSKKKAIEAEMEQRIQSVREDYAQEILRLSAQQMDSLEKLQYFSEFNKEEFFSKKKSLELAHGVIGFRIGTPKVKAVGTTLVKAFQAVKMAGLPFIRTKEELDKDKIISSRKDEISMSKLSAIGLEVVQDETFFVEPKEEVYA